jgi:hypothetical protein
MILKFHTDAGWRFVSAIDVEILTVSVHAAPGAEHGLAVTPIREGKQSWEQFDRLMARAPVRVDVWPPSFSGLDASCPDVAYRAAYLASPDGEVLFVLFDEPCYLMTDEGKTIEAFKPL